jgi:hypothetical protein
MKKEMSSNIFLLPNSLVGTGVKEINVRVLGHLQVTPTAGSTCMIHVNVMLPWSEMKIKACTTVFFVM